MAHETVLIIDDELPIRRSIARRLQTAGYDVVEAESGHAGLAHAAAGVSLAIVGRNLPDIDGLALVAQLRQTHPDTISILRKPEPCPETAAKARRLGALHFATKPLDLEAVVLLVAQASETLRLRRELRRLHRTQAEPYSLDNMVGSSAEMQEFRTLLGRIATSPASTVLLMGESGTGKDLAAKILHYTSARAARPFVNITCSALPEHLLESELFGHERGAFTDARQQKRGLLEQADGGTVFLDEIGEMRAPLQAKILRFLEEKALRRVGGTTDIRVDVRVVAATNRTLEDEVHAGHFREDLFYRLNVLPLRLPTLRAHLDDIPALVAFYIEVFNREFKKDVKGISPAALTLLRSHGWPGNVRELRNVVERAVLLAAGDTLEPADFPIQTTRGNHVMDLPASGISLEDVERDLVRQALQRTGWNQTRAAKLLGLNRDQIHYRIEKFRLHE